MCRLGAFVRFYTEREGIKYDTTRMKPECWPLRSNWIHELGVVSVALYLRDFQFQHPLIPERVCDVSKRSG
jgi:hypothetical protein